MMMVVVVVAVVVAYFVNQCTLHTRHCEEHLTWVSLLNSHNNHVGRYCE